MSTPPLEKPATSHELSPHIGVRLTLPHTPENLALIQQALGPTQRSDGIEDYVLWPHLGDATEKPHYHLVFLPSECSRQAFSNRLKNVGLSGNKDFSVKVQPKSILLGVSYLSHDTRFEPTCGSELAKSWVDTAPPWIEQRPGKLAPGQPVPKPLKEKLGDPVLTLTNVVKQGVRVSRIRKLTSLTAAILYLTRKESWVPSRDITQGIPAELFDEYAVRMGIIPDTTPQLWARPHHREINHWQASDSEPFDLCGNPGNSKKRWADHVFKDDPVP